MKKIYKLHRSLSIIIAFPVLLWASSGFMHPLMTTIRPAVATQGWPVIPVDPSRLRVSLTSALSRHHLDSFLTVRLVHIDTNWFYQVVPGRGAGPVYLSCANGNVLPAGDWLYAQYLARYFLEGGVSRSGIRMMADASAPDCCGDATECVLHPARGAKVANVSSVKAYDREYKSINRLLPVYRVSFDRADGIRIYIETTQDRFSFAMDDRRAVFDELFRIFHTWGWLDIMGRWKDVVVFLVAALAFCTVLLGLYLFVRLRAPRAGVRRLHRYTAVVAALFTLFWSFSGAWQALSKATGPEDRVVGVQQRFGAGEGMVDVARLAAAAGAPIGNIGLVKMEGKDYWRVSLVPARVAVVKDLMRDGRSAGPGVVYVAASDYSVLKEGDRRYAVFLAGVLSGSLPVAPLAATPVTAFDDEYNFTDKRLPVWRVSYPGNGHPRWYVETCSGQLAARMDDATYAEGFSFSVFHKHHFMDWGGKAVRDVSTMFWAVIQLLMVVVGLIMYFRFRK
ncbi:MAG: PepSY domain-containing protein [Bacteroidetes bacterium]|nr:PepSY domain-containing protein [Bacteroidota bacterium]